MTMAQTATEPSSGCDRNQVRGDAGLGQPPAQRPQQGLKARLEAVERHRRSFPSPLWGGVGVGVWWSLNPGSRTS